MIKSLQRSFAKIRNRRLITASTIIAAAMVKAETSAQLQGIIDEVNFEAIAADAVALARQVQKEIVE